MFYSISPFLQKLTWLDKCGDAHVRRPVVFLFPFLIIGYSVWQGMYNLDPHHWGLMLSNAKDLVDGKQPYRDIFIQYGLLTTMIQGAAYAFVGNDLRTLIGITSCFYAAGLVGIYFLSLRVTEDRKLALFSFISACLLHPLAIYPWSNYIAFPFLVFGAWFLLDPRGRGISAFLAGLIFGLSVLGREGLLPAVLAFSIIYSVVNLIFARDSIRLRIVGAMFYWVGFILPLALFFVYLQKKGLVQYWYKTSVLLPKMYISVLMPHGVTGAVAKLFLYFIKGLIGLNARVMFFSLILLSSVCVALKFIRGRDTQRPPVAHFLLAILTLLLLSASLHGNEIFRLASSVTAGIVLLYWVARNHGLENLLFFVSFTVLVASFGHGKDGNYFSPSSSQLSQSVVVLTPGSFRGQRWPQQARDFYQSFDRDMKDLAAANCGIRYFQNTSHDAFLAVLSPFRQFQVAPFSNDIGWENLRPELDADRKVAEDKDLVLFLKMPLSSANAYEPPAGYVEARRYVMPKVEFFDQGEFLLVVVPDRCSAFVND